MADRTTYLDAINSVLTRLRRDTVVSTGSSTYASLIGQLVNEAKREVEDAWGWSEIRAEIAITTDTTNRTYLLAGTGERTRVQGVWNTTRSQLIRPASDYEIEKLVHGGSQTAGPPSRWRLNEFTASEPVLEFERVPDQAYAITVVCSNPQADLVNAAEAISVPHWPVVLGAYAKALAERGDDGAMGNNAMAIYENALDDAIARDNHNKAYGRQTDWFIE